MPMWLKGEMKALPASLQKNTCFAQKVIKEEIWDRFTVSNLSLGLSTMSVSLPLLPNFFR